MTTTQTTSQPMNGVTSLWGKLFEPLKPAESARTDAGQTTPVTGENGQNPSVSQTAPLGGNPAMSGLDHTKIPAFSTSDTPGQGGSTPLAGGTGANNVSLGGMVQGRWAVDIIDSLLPAALVAALYAAGLKLRKSEMQLTEKEKDILAPIWQKCLDSILLNFDSPWTMLAVTMGALYGGKLVDRGVVAYVDKQGEEKQAEVLRQKVAAAERAADPAKFDPANQSAADLQAGNVTYAGGLPFSEQDIKDRMVVGKCNREKAIKFLKNKFGVKE